MVAVNGHGDRTWEEPEAQELHPDAVELATRACVHARGAVGSRPSLPANFKRWFNGVSSVRDELPRFPLCTPGMSASELPHLPEPAPYTFWGTPCQSRPFWLGSLQSFESLERVPAPAFLLALHPQSVIVWRVRRRRRRWLPSKVWPVRTSSWWSKTK